MRWISPVLGRAPRICFLATAQGDNPFVVFNLYSAAQERGFHASHVSLVPMPNVEDITAHFLGSDVVWVCGGSVAALFALWRLHEVDVAWPPLAGRCGPYRCFSGFDLLAYRGNGPILMGPRYGR